MRVFGSAFVLCLVGVAAAAIGTRDSVDDARLPEVRAQQSETAGVVAGNVTDGQGAALHDVTVELLRGGAVVQTARTNARGEFRFASVVAGVYEVRATRQGVVPVTVRVAVSTLPTPPLRLSLGIPAEASESASASQKAQVAPGASGGLAKVMPSPIAPPAAAPGPVNQSAADASSRPAIPRSRNPPFNTYPPFNTEAYDRIDDNRFRRAADEPLSTFSIDVDTASYANVRRFLNEGHAAAGRRRAHRGAGQLLPLRLSRTRRTARRSR